MNLLKKAGFAALLIPLLSGCNCATKTDNTNIDAIVKERILTLLNETRTTQYFSKENVPVEDMTAILEAGKNATSGRNMQAWYFGAIINPEKIQEIASDMPKRIPPPPSTGDQPKEGAPVLPHSSSKYPKAGFVNAPAAIVLACPSDKLFDLGLASENMAIAARALGYGIKIVKGGVDHLNNEANRTLLNIPDDMNVELILLIGKPDPAIDLTADGVTGASIRKSLDEVSTIIQ